MIFFQSFFLQDREQKQHFFFFGFFTFFLSGALPSGCIIKKHIYFLSSHSGLCTILRSEAGGQVDAIAEGCDDDPAYRNNAHLLSNDDDDDDDDEKMGQHSNHVAYYDAAALYPSSGKQKFFSHTHTHTHTHTTIGRRKSGI